MGKLLSKCFSKRSSGTSQSVPPKVITMEDVFQAAPFMWRKIIEPGTSVLGVSGESNLQDKLGVDTDSLQSLYLSYLYDCDLRRMNYKHFLKFNQM